MAPRIVLVPFPLTPIAAFGFFLRHLGMIPAGIVARYHDSVGRASASIMLGNDVVLNLAGPQLVPYLGSLIAKATKAERRLLKRFLTYAAAGDPQRGHPFRRWLAERSLIETGPTPVLEAAACWFSSCLGTDADPWRCENLRLPRSEARSSAALNTRPPDMLFLTLPVFKSSAPGEREIIAAAPVRLAEGRIWDLAGFHLAIAIGGPSGSGKSTLAASLATELSHRIASLKTRPGWDGLPLSVEMVNLDLATPTVDAIANGTGKNRKLLATRKRPWNDALAKEALEALLAAKASTNIVIADLPGGPIDPITEIVAVPADAVILLAHDWAFMAPWQEFAVRRMGLTLISRARSRRTARDFDPSLPRPKRLLASANRCLELLRQAWTGRPDNVQGFASVVTRYREGEIIAGRVMDLDRVDRSWDRFISWLAEFLLFDILPSLVTRRRERLERILRETDQAPPPAVP